MKAGQHGWIIFVATGVFYAQATPDAVRVLDQVRDRVVKRISHLPDYTCVQTINRSYFRRARRQQPAPSCSQIHADKEAQRDHLGLYLTDRLRLDVKVSGSEEIGSWAGASQFNAKSIFDFVGGGPFGTGALGTFATDVFTSGEARFSYIGEKLENSSTLYTYRYRVPLEASHYRIRVWNNWQPIPYEGEVEVDPQSLEIRHLLVRAGQLPPESDTCEMETRVDYAVAQMNTGEFLLPRQTKMHLMNTDGDERDVTTTYAECREYRSESAIFFEDHPVARAEKNTKAAGSAALPKGLPITLELVSPIDTDVAAAGDVVMERVRWPVRERGSKNVLIPEGATVRGRIVQMQHWTTRPARFEIAILLESWEVDDISAPLYAEPNGGEATRGVLINLPPIAQSTRVRIFVFMTGRKHYVVPRGFASRWITVTAPGELTRGTTCPPRASACFRISATPSRLRSDNLEPGTAFVAI